MRSAVETAFVTDPTGFIGAELIRTLVARGHRVVALTPSAEAAERVRRAGATAVIGSLGEPGAWQERATADWVFHLPPDLVCSPHASRGRYGRLAAPERMRMDAHLLDAMADGNPGRIVYVTNTSSYGVAGPRAITEDEPYGTSPWRHDIGPVLDRIGGYVTAGLPIAMAFTGWVYGNGGWFRRWIVDPIVAGRRLPIARKTGPSVSPIHVHDCARALIHLAERGAQGGKYFVVNTRPILLQEFAETFARLSRRQLQMRAWSTAAARRAFGPLMAEYLERDAVFSNIRLRGTGFRFLYPTLDDGIRQILELLA